MRCGVKKSWDVGISKVSRNLKTMHFCNLNVTKLIISTFLENIVCKSFPFALIVYRWWMWKVAKCMAITCEIPSIMTFFKNAILQQKLLWSMKSFIANLTWNVHLQKFNVTCSREFRFCNATVKIHKSTVTFYSIWPSQNCCLIMKKNLHCLC